MEKRRNSGRFYFLGLQNHCGWWLQPWNYKTLPSWKKNYDQPRQCIKKQRHHFANKDPYSESYGFSSSHVWMWELHHKESWMLKNWYFWTVVLEKTVESPLDCKEIQPVHPKGDQDWIFIGRTDSEAENTLATWRKVPAHWKRPYCWERLRTKGKGGKRGRGGWMASPTQWTWAEPGCGRQWGREKPGVLQLVGLQRSRAPLSTWTTAKSAGGKFSFCMSKKFLFHLLFFWNIFCWV